MEKDFKKEYSKHIKSETPDLWARIESGLTEKTPASKPRRWGKWMAAVPAAAAVVLLVVAAPIFMPKGSFSSMEKAAMDLALFDGKADSAAPEAGFYEEEAVAEESIPEYMLEKEEADTGKTVDGGVNANLSSTLASGSGGSSAENKTESANTTSGGAADSNPENTDTYAERQETQTTTDEKDGITEEQKAEKEMTEEKVLHLQVVEQIPTDNTNLLAEDKEHITQTYDLYLVLVDGEEKLLAVPIEVEMEFETQVWYDVTVTEAEEPGIDYIWVK